MSVMTPTSVESASYWHAVALLRLERSAGLAALETEFARGGVPAGLRGPLRGRFLASTLGHGFDPPFEALTAVWLPWKGKTFEPDAEQGRNLFTAGTRRLMRVTLPKYRPTSERSGTCGAFRFMTSTGPSAFTPDVEVLRNDYRDVPENPSWPIRKILDELVMIEEGLYLGQALMEFRGTLRRAAWFSLEWQPIPTVAHAS
jgi:hypothetical protein